MKLMKELYFICAMKSSVVFSAFKHKLSTAGHCTEHTCSAKAAVQLLSLHFMSRWTTHICHMEKVISTVIKGY